MTGTLTSLFSAFGLAGAAGLNAYVPLLGVALAGRFGALTLRPPFDTLAETWCIALLAVLLVVEIIVDKFPVADHANDVLQTFVRPAAGALVFAAETGAVEDVHPAVFVTLGLVTALGVHGTKAAARPVVNATTAGVGAPVVSTVEDGVAAATTVTALVFPWMVGACAMVFVALAILVFVKRRRSADAAPARMG